MKTTNVKELEAKIAALETKIEKLEEGMTFSEEYNEQDYIDI